MGIATRLGNLLRRERIDADIEEELRSHLELAAEDAERHGLSPGEARRSARLRFGNATALRERTAGADTIQALDEMGRELRRASRQLRRSPAFALTAVITLALGIGANSAVFSAIDAVLLRPLPFPAADRLMSLEQHRAKTPNNLHAAFVRVKDWDGLNSTFQSISGYYRQDDSETSVDPPETLRRVLVAPRFLEVWGIAPMIGRDFSPAEEQFGGPSAILISERFWRRRFNGDPAAIGRQLHVSGGSYPIVGVMPASFAFPDPEVDLW